MEFPFTTQQVIEEGRVSQQDIILIKKWVQTQTLPILRDEQIVQFLLSCSNDQERTKATIKSFYSLRKKAPEIFDSRKIDRIDIQKQLQTIYYCVFPERTDDDCVISFGKFRDTDYSKFEMGPYMKLAFMSLDSAIYDRPPKGLIMLIDMEGTTLMHLTRLKLGLVKVFLQYLQEGLPVKLKDIHILNSAYFLDKLLALIKPFAKKEVMEMIHFHPKPLDMEMFYKKWIPKRCLPKELGGELPSISILNEKSIQKLIDMQGYFEAEELQRHSVQL